MTMIDFTIHNKDKWFFVKTVMGSYYLKSDELPYKRGQSYAYSINDKTWNNTQIPLCFKGDILFYIEVTPAELTEIEILIKQELDLPNAVEHPKHYGGKNNTYEAIKVINAWKLNFSLGNVVKYISRAGKKGDYLEDLKKAKFYLENEINNYEKI